MDLCQKYSRNVDYVFYTADYFIFGIGGMVL